MHSLNLRSLDPRWQPADDGGIPSDTPQPDAFSAIPEASTPRVEPMAPPAEPPTSFAPPSYVLPEDEAPGLLTQTRRWIQEHPVAAVLVAAGIGVVVGRLLSSDDEEDLDVPPPPETRLAAVKHSLQTRLDDARPYAEAARDVLNRSYATAREAVGDATTRAADAVHEGAERTQDLAEVVGEIVKESIRDLKKRFR